MNKKIIYSIKSPYRQRMDVTGFTFGDGELSCCIVGALRGNEIQQMAICAQLVDTLKRLEEKGRIAKGKSIMIIPCVNNYSMNIGKRFWTMDNTDINRMFPGYDLGETTQRIADGLFKEIKDYQYGIQMASFYQKGEFTPHVKVMNTDINKKEHCPPHVRKSLLEFGLPFGLIREPMPYDTATLNYNWQIWNCEAFSLFASYTEHIGRSSTQTAVNAALRFLTAKGILKIDLTQSGTQFRTQFSAPKIHGSHTRILSEDKILRISAHCAGILKKHVSVGEEIKKGYLLCEIIHPLEGNVIDQIVSEVNGTVFFSCSEQLIMEYADIFNIVPE